MGGISGVHFLTDQTIRKSNPPAMLRDGGNLFVQIKAGQKGRASRSFIFRYQRDGRDRHMGLGAYPKVSLAAARAEAAKARDLLAAGIDPLDQRHTVKATKRLAAAREKTFDQCGDEFIARNQREWTNVKHAAQWRSSLSRYVTPTFGKLSVQAVDRAAVIRALDPIWRTKTETAERVRGRIERILDFAEARGYRPEGSNPARRGAIKAALGSQKKRVKHHAALPYAELPAFMETLRARSAIAARALEFAILTAARTAEVVGATWGEIDLPGRTWKIPGPRMKSGREHVVVLCDDAAGLLEQMQGLHDGPHVFPGPKPGKPLSNMAMLTLLRRMDRADITTHGFRSSFRTWAAEQTAFERELIEKALAHTLGPLDLAYQRGAMVTKRRELVAAWAQYLAGDQHRTRAAG
jgi:integrase